MYYQRGFELHNVYCNQAAIYLDKINPYILSEIHTSVTISPFTAKDFILRSNLYRFSRCKGKDTQTVRHFITIKHTYHLCDLLQTNYILL